MRLAYAINPHRQKRIGEEAAGTPTVRMIVMAISAIWAAGLAMATLGAGVGHGAWPSGVEEAVFLPIFLGLLALPVSLMATWGGIIGVASIALAILFWPLVLSLQIAAAYHRRWI